MNVTYDDLQRPVLGPENPYQDVRIATQNMISGHVEQQAISEMDFRTQLRTFETYGYARDPSISADTNLAGQTGHGTLGTGFVGDLNSATQLGGATVYDKVDKKLRNNKDYSKKREKKGKLDQLDGPDAYKGPWAGYEDDNVGIPTGLDVEDEEEETPTTTTTEEPVDESKFSVQNIATETATETTTFHGASEFDYLGRTYMAVPQDIGVNLFGESGSQQCFVPKKLVHTWEGHEKGVSAIRFFPNSAHLLLSGGMDNQVKVKI